MKEKASVRGIISGFIRHLGGGFLHFLVRILAIPFIHFGIAFTFGHLGGPLFHRIATGRVRGLFR